MRRHAALGRSAVDERRGRSTQTALERANGRTDRPLCQGCPREAKIPGADEPRLGNYMKPWDAPDHGWPNDRTREV